MQELEQAKSTPKPSLFSTMELEENEQEDESGDRCEVLFRHLVPRLVIDSHIVADVPVYQLSRENAGV